MSNVRRILTLQNGGLLGIGKVYTILPLISSEWVLAKEELVLYGIIINEA